MMESWRLFWAKTNREKVEGLPEDWTHPLWAHLIDVGSTAWLLWERYLPLALKRIMTEAVGMDTHQTGRFLSIWIGLHDLGKAIPSFQGLYPPAKQNLEASGLFFHEEPNRLHHGHATIAIVYRWLRAKGLRNDTLLDAAAACVGIHHGKICKSCVWEDVAHFSEDNPKAVLGNQQWRTAQQLLAEQVFAAWGAWWPDADRLPEVDWPNHWPDWLMAFAGWATLADWLGSMQTCFDTSVRAEDSLSDYLATSLTGAEKALQTAGLDQVAQLQARSFQEHFRYDPRPLQQVAADLPLKEDQPTLVIVEGPTGEGKTEAAFYLSARLGSVSGGGIYVAMPSQSTSDGIFPRLQRFIQGDKEQGLVAAHDGNTAVLRLVHGNDLLREDALSLLKIDQATVAIDDDDLSDANNQGKDRSLSWFMPKKRALLVPYGVGTVDQLFLGVLHARHFFLRLFSLSGKTVIFDEVHAYDAYMNTIFERLLHWLKALHVNVIILSATLPSETRHRLLKAWGGQSATGEDTAYPVVWQSDGHQVRSYPLAPTPGRSQRLTFQWCSDEVVTIAQQAEQYIRQGATVMVVCNTVVRAQQVFQLLDRDKLLPKADRMLLHARMPQAWRQKREKAALDRFGENRPARPALLVGTQVIEQSLDIDADVMITDLAPVDLLLQRAGRLHRHRRERSGHARPEGFEQPTLLIACCPAEQGELPNVDSISGGGRVYAPVLLWRTWGILQEVNGWHLPLGEGNLPGYRILIEAVYAELAEAPSGLSEEGASQYREEHRKWHKQDRRKRGDASQRLVPDIDRLHELFAHDEIELQDEEKASGRELPKHLQAFTRSPDGISAEVLLLYRQEKGWSITADGSIVLPKKELGFLSQDRLRTLFGAAVRISHPGVVTTLWEESNPEWEQQQEQHRVLKRFHLIELNENREAIVGKTKLVLDSRLGLLYE